MNTNLAEDLKYRYNSCRIKGHINYYSAYALLFIAVLSSALATLSISIELFPKPINAILASFSGILYLINKQFKFEERAKWWYSKFYTIESLYRSLVFEDMPAAEVSKSLTQTSKELLEKWPGFSERLDNKE